MTDPWVDERERAEQARRYVDDGWPAWNWNVYSLDDAEHLLTDADALLVVKEVAEIALKLITAIKASDGPVAVFYKGTDVLTELDEALAALPEHLKG